jgi:hypothetical protein
MATTLTTGAGKGLGGRVVSRDERDQRRTGGLWVVGPLCDGRGVLQASQSSPPTDIDTIIGSG